jgi:hypothetical protein
VTADSFNGTVQISVAGQPGVPGGVTTAVAVGGRATFENLVFAQPGLYSLSASSPGLTAAGHPFPVRVAGMTELVMPRYIQGRQPVNEERVPYAFLVRIDGLAPNATYRYANQIVNEDDPATLEGAGNMTFVDPAGGNFTRSTESPRFLPEDVNLRHGEFVSDASGSHTRWFVTEPSGNIRFDKGNSVRVRILLNDGNGGDIAFHHLTAVSPVEVISFGTGVGDGSALYGESAASPKHFAVLYEDAAGGTRPLAATPVESTGAGTDFRHAPFYQTMVAGWTGRWGTIIPNHLATGVRRVEERDGVNGGIVSVFTSPDGNRPSTGLAAGLQPTGMRIPAAGAGGFDLWQAARFSLAELGSPGVGGASGDADGDAVTNLLEYAFGMDPLVPAQTGLPGATIETGSGPSRELAFRYRRRMGDHGLSYLVEISPNASQWQPWTGTEETAPNPDGVSETVTRRLPLAPEEPRRFLRLRVENP